MVPEMWFRDYCRGWGGIGGCSLSHIYIIYRAGHAVILTFYVTKNGFIFMFYHIHIPYTSLEVYAYTIQYTYTHIHIHIHLYTYTYISQVSNKWEGVIPSRAKLACIIFGLFISRTYLRDNDNFFINLGLNFASLILTHQCRFGLIVPMLYFCFHC